MSNMSYEVRGERSRQAAPEGQRWGNRYTDEADTCVQGQISCPKLCVWEVVLCCERRRDSNSEESGTRRAASVQVDRGDFQRTRAVRDHGRRETQDWCRCYLG